MDDDATADDTALLAAARHRSAAFGVFYERHERRILRFLVARTRDAELAADLCAEVFAEALAACRAGEVRPRVPVAWLLGIAAHKLADSARAGQVQDRARRRLQMRAVELTRGQLSEIERLLAEDEASCLLAGLTAQQRIAVREHVLDGRPYDELARRMCCSELVVRKRVSRGLAVLRARIESAT